MIRFCDAAFFRQLPLHAIQFDYSTELRRLLDHLVNDHSRLSYVVLPGVN